MGRNKTQEQSQKPTETVARPKVINHVKLVSAVDIEEYDLYELIEGVGSTRLRSLELDLHTDHPAYQSFQRVKAELVQLEKWARGDQSLFPLIQEISKIVHNIFSEAICEGITSAADSFHAETTYAVLLLENLEALFAMQSIARRMTEWPVIVKPAILKKSHELSRLKTLELGSEATHYPAFTTETNRLVAVMVRTIQRNRRMLKVRERALRLKATNRDLYSKTYKVLPFPDWAIACGELPPLSSETWKQWFKVGWAALMEETQGHPEKYPSLRQIGAYREKHSFHTGAMAKVTPGTAEADIRDGLRSRLRAAFKCYVKA